MPKLQKIKDGIIDNVKDAKDKAAGIIKDGSAYVADKASQAKQDYDLRRFKPLTEEQLLKFVEEMPDMIQITDWDKRQEEEVCKDAVAFNDGDKDIKAISIITKNAGLLNASFYPSMQEGIYYKDPCNPYYFINLNDYFDFLKKARVHELNQIAQDLGAKHIKITLKSEKKVFVQKQAKVGIAVGKKDKTKEDVSKEYKNMQFDSIEVASEKDFKGHEAQEPQLNYFKNEPDILYLIESRLDKNNPIKYDKATFKYINSSGIKKKDAVKIEGVLKKLKISGNASISNEVENEERILFEYQIEYPEE